MKRNEHTLPLKKLPEYIVVNFINRTDPSQELLDARKHR